MCRAWGAQEHGPGLLVWAELARRADAAADAQDGTAARGDLGWGAPPPRPGTPGDPEPEPADDTQPENGHHGRHRFQRHATTGTGTEAEWV